MSSDNDNPTLRTISHSVVRRSETESLIKFPNAFQLVNPNCFYSNSQSTIDFIHQILSVRQQSSQAPFNCYSDDQLRNAFQSTIDFIHQILSLSVCKAGRPIQLLLRPSIAKSTAGKRDMLTIFTAEFQQQISID
ncbi:hypothetical protein CDAR_194731 [Caerostris darwini]|uniref:Uncharacterized protein n=1 Tax=Caerostris darwini TaxID=1538125 RepID=A0AAV4X8Y0_9ARAC|nr:hypothetical protein CDAR_194731 [Caerostris darwini]